MTSIRGSRAPLFTFKAAIAAAVLALLGQILSN
jgi:hypothetical protein